MSIVARKNANLTNAAVIPTKQSAWRDPSYTDSAIAEPRSLDFAWDDGCDKEKSYGIHLSRSYR